MIKLELEFVTVRGSQLVLYCYVYSNISIIVLAWVFISGVLT